jgi:hypothetical protein
MSEVHGYLCDYCGDYADGKFIGPLRDRLMDIPEGWIRYAKRTKVAHSYHLCAKCVEKKGL